MQFRPADVPPGTDEWCSGWRLASRRACLRTIHISERRVHHQQASTQGFDCLAAPVAAAPARRARLFYGMPFPAAKAALELQPVASAVSQGNPSVREGMEGIARLGSRAAATDAICGAAPCAIVLPGPFTPPGTAELCSGRRLASRRVCCARLLSPSAVCTPAGDDTRTRSPRCPNPASSRPCTLRAAIYDILRGIFGGGSSLETAASCICRVAGVIQLSWCRCRRWRNTQSHNEPVAIQEGQREQTTATSSTPRHPDRSPSEPSYPSRFMRSTRTS